MSCLNEENELIITIAPQRVEFQDGLSGNEDHLKYLQYLENIVSHYSCIPAKVEAQLFFRRYGFGDPETRIIPLDDIESMKRILNTDPSRDWWLGLAIYNDMADPNLPPDVAKIRTSVQRGSNNEGIHSEEELVKAWNTQKSIARSQQAFGKMFPQDTKGLVIYNVSVRNDRVIVEPGHSYLARDQEISTPPSIQIIPNPNDPDGILILSNSDSAPYLHPLINSLDHLKKFDEALHNSFYDVHEVSYEFMVDTNTPTPRIAFHTDLVLSRGQSNRNPSLSSFIEKIPNAKIIPNEVQSLITDHNKADYIRSVLMETASGNCFNEGALRLLEPLSKMLKKNPSYAPLIARPLIQCVAAVESSVNTLDLKPATSTGRLNSLLMSERPNQQELIAINSLVQYLINSAPKYIN
jgi:hypothetical protein